ncbi:MAG: glycosyltransferase family 2 protein [Burkholderiales bacterium]|nr:glycosyltransferase family 2 protein [Phycisphaerae bacterium]
MKGSRVDRVHISIVVPCLNEVEGLGELHRRLSTVCAAVKESHEILLIDDGSTDGTWEHMLQLCAADKAVRAVRMSRNFGHQLALSAGLTLARGDRVLIIDADLQDPPELLPEMLALIDAGADVVYGQRTAREGETWLKRSTARWFYRLLNQLSEHRIPADTGDFRLITRRVLDILNQMPERHRYIRGMIAWIGLQQVPITYQRKERFAGNTKYPFGKMTKFAFDAITSFSVKPLKLSIWLGLLTSIIAVLMLGMTIVAWFLDLAVVGWSSLFAAITFFSSIQLFIIGILGEYLGRVAEQLRGRPLYVIEQVVSGSTDLEAKSSRNALRTESGGDN